MWPFKFKGMIYPKLALGFDDARNVMSRKSSHMVVYLRLRRESVDYTQPKYRRDMAKVALSFARKRHLSND